MIGDILRYRILVGVGILAWPVMVGLIVYVAAHFIIKFW